MTQRRTYKDEPYLRSEHLLKDGKYQSVIVEIADVDWNCPIKRGDKDGTTIGLAFVGSDKILGLNKTNDSMVCWACGQGKAENWIGKKIQLVVRLVSRYIKKELVWEPAIRVWTREPHPRGQVRDQMGREIPDSWYGHNSTTPEKAE